MHIAIEQPEDADLDVIHAFLAETYWAPGIPRALVARACANSRCVIARDGAGALAGFARLITDSATFAWLCDVFVLPQHAGKGLARALVRTFQDSPDLKGIRRWLLATRDAHGVYAPLGFEPLPKPERWMEITLPAPYGKPRG